MAILNVTNAAQLTAALTAARGGDTISLAAGNYGDVSVSNLKPSASIFIMSADPANAAHFDTLAIRTSQNLTFKGLDIGRPLKPGEADFTQLASVRGSTKIVFDGNYIHGSLDGNPQNDGYGLFVDTATALTVVNNTFQQLTRGAVLSTIDNLYVANNRFLDQRSDALDVDESVNVLIEGNLFRGFYPLDYDHPDAIQFQNLNATRWTENVTIRNNILLPGGTGGGPQGVWISDPGTTGFRNFVIENNLLWGKGLYNGIGLGGVYDSKVIGNTVLSPTDDTKTMWIRVSAGDNIELTNNVAEDYILQTGATNVRQSGNVNLRTSPAMRALMVDPESPESWNDVLLNGVGVSVPKALATEAPISGAVGTALKGLLSPITGQSFAQMLSIQPVDDDELDFSGLTDLVPDAPTAAAGPYMAEPAAIEAAPHYFSQAWNAVHQDWFVALP